MTAAMQQLLVFLRHKRETKSDGAADTEICALLCEQQRAKKRET